MKKSAWTRIVLGVVVGMALLTGAVLLLTLTLGNAPHYVYAGKSLPYWEQQLNGGDTAASNEAFTAVNNQVIPELIENMLHDTNDSSVRLFVIESLNDLPGVQIYFTPADARRAEAAGYIGELGPSAKAAVPVLIQVLKGKDAAVHGAAIRALGDIHSDPEEVIPLLIGYLDDENLDDAAALALANYGALAKAAVPKIIPMLHAPDKDAQAAARAALPKIDPEAYIRATAPNPPPSTNGSAIRAAEK